MAKSVSVSVYAIGARTARLHIEPRWWPADVLCHDPRFQQSNDTGSYNDWTAELNEDAFLRLHEEFRPLATTGIYHSDDWQLRIQPQIQVLDATLKGALGTISHVNVTVFEWESGL